MVYVAKIFVSSAEIPAKENQEMSAQHYNSLLQLKHVKLHAAC